MQIFEKTHLDPGNGSSLKYWWSSASAVVILLVGSYSSILDNKSKACASHLASVRESEGRCSGSPKFGIFRRFSGCTFGYLIRSEFCFGEFRDLNFLDRREWWGISKKFETHWFHFFSSKVPFHCTLSVLLQWRCTIVCSFHQSDHMRCKVITSTFLHVRDARWPHEI